ncbi:TIR domain-containing protein [Methylomonas sp. MS20]|uniref:TIR domain-containing protein n=1 Tax=unclassified Methylomonas TaxID=2608980 RepID=UPI0028A41488|nr:TIR domain-containing protein [Methylomonas sp. MV1]MDT4332035.1 TIR domain-containing protein [Methylomonas sp. MV1]
MVTDIPPKRFRIAFSFAGEKRDFVQQTARILAERFGEEKILYDEYHEEEFSRARLGRYLPRFYHDESDLVVVVLCQDYLQKEWPGLEWDAIFDLIKKRRDDDVMLTRFDRAEIAELYDAGYTELDDKSPEQFATKILRRLALNESKPKDHYTKDLNFQAASEVAPTPSPTVCAHDATTLKKLETKEAESFVQSIQKFLPQYFSSVPTLRKPADLIRFFCASRSGEDEIGELFFVVREALREQPPTLNRTAAEEAAALLYCIAARQAVDAVVAKANMERLGAEVIEVPYDQNIVCAVIVNALFGGTLILKAPDPADIPSLPRPEWVLDTDALPNGENLTGSLECAVFNALFKNSKLSPQLCLDSDGLTDQQKALLKNRIKDIKKRNLSLALVVRGSPPSGVAVEVSKNYSLPLFLPSKEICNEILAMDANTLIAHIFELWELMENI